MAYQIPRNVKSGLSFMGLEWKGWLLFIPTVAIFGTLAIFLIPKIEIKVIALLLIVGISFFSFAVNERTGAMNFTDFTDLISWIKSDKVMEPVWDDSFDRYNSMFIKVSTIDPIKLAAYRMYLDELDKEVVEDAEISLSAELPAETTSDEKKGAENIGQDTVPV